MSLILAFFCPLLCPCPLFAGQAGVWAWGEGLAKVGPDIGLARDLAVLRAKQAALESVGICINSRSIAVRGRLMDEMAIVQTSGLVEDFDVVHEELKGGYYRVALRARLKSAKRGEHGFGTIFQNRTIKVTAKGPGSIYVQDQLERGLLKRFYFVVKPENENRPFDFNITVQSRVEEYSKYQGISSFSAVATIVMAQVSTGKQALFVTTGSPALIYGHNMEQAINGNTVNQFNERVAKPLLQSFWNELETFERRGARTVRVSIADLPNHNAFIAFREYVKNICLGMERIESEQYSKGNGILMVQYREKSFYLASIIGYKSEYEIEHHDWSNIDVVYVERGHETGVKDY